MNNIVYIPCPSCGALGVLGSNCAFCGSTIQGKSDMPQSSALITVRKTISDDEYIRKTSKYNWVGTFTKDDIAAVFAGGQYGVINRNADLIIPLDYDTISFVEDFVLLERKQSCCALSVKFWDYLKRPDGDILTFSNHDVFRVRGACKTGQIAICIEGRDCIYEPKNNTCVLMDSGKHLHPLGRGFAVFTEKDDYDLHLGRFHSGYVLGDGTFIFRDKPYSFEIDAYHNDVDTNADSVELRFRNLGWLPFKTNMDPEPQFKEFFEKCSEQSAKNAKSEKVYKILKIVVIIMFIWAITMFALAIFV